MWDILIFAKNEPRDIMGVALVMRRFKIDKCFGRVVFFQQKMCCYYFGVSYNGGTQQPWVFLLKMTILGCFGGTPIFGNTHFVLIISCSGGQLKFRKTMENMEVAFCKNCFLRTPPKSTCWPKKILIWWPWLKIKLCNPPGRWLESLFPRNCWLL